MIHLVFLNYQLGIGGILLYALYSVHAGLLSLVSLGYGYNFAVAGLQPETELARLVSVYFEFGMVSFS